MPPVTEILFGDQDGLRTGSTAAGPVASIQVAPPGDGVTEITTVESGGGNNYVFESVELGGGLGFGMEGGAGSMTPPNIGIATIDAFSTFDFFPSITRVVLSGGVFDQDFFTSITFNGITLLTADAAFGFNEWAWETDLINATGTFPVTIT